ncbi:MAG TPA: hypothetical protein VGX91_03000 [Candidatus Cybelea sp.]|nr:hypothetical protein [Candidatus Cybelea sp.]
MNVMLWNYVRCATGACALVPLLAACAGIGESLPSRPAPEVRVGVAPASSGELLYVSEYGGKVVDVFSYPQDVFLGNVAGLVGTPQGECVDKKGNVWIVETGGHPTIQRFAHGGSGPAAQLSDEGENPYGCSVDPTTGNLAVSSEYSSTSFQGSVAIYKNATGTPAIFIDKKIELVLWCGYDDKGNLFVDGLPPDDAARFGPRAKKASEFALAELPKGRKTFTDIALSGIKFPGNIQWDGTSLTIGNPAYRTGSAIERVQVTGATAKITGTTVLKGSYEVFGSWIQGDTVIGPDEGSGTSAVYLWKYPGGGKPTATLSKGSSMFFNGPFGAAVSP